MKVRSFCPGHITGFFQIIEHEAPLRSGSRGAGLCIGLGAKCALEARPGEGIVRVRMDGQESEAPVTVDAVRGLPGAESMDFEIEITNALPIGQGFGLSAAGAIAAAHAASTVLGLGLSDAIASAHLAELRNRTGLGDVAAISRGGIAFRRKEGIPPHGHIERIDGDPEIVICVVGEPISTAAVLADPIMRSKVNEVGGECVERFGLSPTLDELMRLSREFMRRVGLATPEVEEAVATAERAGGSASMVIFGSSIFAVGDVDKIEIALAPLGQVGRCKVDLRGPRLM